MLEKIYDNITIKPIVVQIAYSGKRLDWVLSELLPQFSRSQIKRWIINKKVVINNQISVLPKKKVISGEIIEINDINNDSTSDCNNNILIPQNISLNIVYEDNDILVINKPSNMVVHPGVKNNKDTVLNALLYRYPSIMQISKQAGIVQRLDKDTTGLMIIAKTYLAYTNLLQSFKMKQVIKEYDAVVCGTFSYNAGIISQPIRRHSINRTCMTVHPHGKPAVTRYSVVESFGRTYSRIRVYLETGRTHQIRVHMAYINHPVVGDVKYGIKFKNSTTGKLSISDDVSICLSSFNRQALHACKLQLVHPITRLKMHWIVPLPEDMLKLVTVLKKM
ncbi:ribosomal large subunit pseudouridine synthase D [Candidatus Blochmanniella vafra str. BVAF]|uniref:Pseudouridine synthase n=1 Tax=Blochmanniella vafra (strain BVAF) TaxID=859654 RepID=E8Q5U0_BLOVB|nr:23S rRNA pseudouridine(1911/1915/1917) synthase RluD [Candidatus Blochmannia vafer]ADV33587.1 ribosomal large subunit pseudouridine synthase D [Candidatus Blochmannia vafer str. BVAF]